MDTRGNWNLTIMQENHGFNDDDDEEALSLCDLALNNSNGSEWDDSSKEDQRLSFDQDIFEFFSEDFNASTHPRENVIFCGKLIPYKGDKKDAHVEKIDKSINKTKESKRSFIFRWKSFSLHQSRNNSLKMQQQKSYTTCTSPDINSENNEYRMKKCAQKYDVSMRKISVFASPSRSKWHPFTFGMGRYPVEMELSDIKTRQSKRNESKKRQSTNGRNELAGKNGQREKGWWSLLRILGCNSNKANAMVKASLGLMPLPNV
ncbi:uncharacterized protein LOC126661181 [Mercurialis annua]|uniref:uncharacterized protein LOC126661181 n=1 Tax=Mercurialis annua TaxID=3986 RepID=UPI00215FFA8B|nr:uncharacterized protein LOC126661181 [Mercurialis annua]